MSLVDRVVAPGAPPPPSAPLTPSDPPRPGGPHDDPADPADPADPTQPADPGALACVPRLHRALLGRPDLRPCAEVDALFGELVRAVVGVPPGAPTGVPQHCRCDLQRLCAAGEHELEHAWSGRVAGAADPASALARFPYLGNYRRLVRFEVDVLGRTARRRVRRVAFLGSGPLPLSALFLSSALGAGAGVDAVDRDPASLAAGQRVVTALGATGIGFVEGDAAALDASGYDVVVLAALVGVTPAAKRAVLAHLAEAMAPGALLLARSARAARTLLYPAVEPSALAGFEVQAVVHPVDDVVNSVVVARAAGTPDHGGR